MYWYLHDTSKVRDVLTRVRDILSGCGKEGAKGGGGGGGRGGGGGGGPQKRGGGRGGGGGKRRRIRKGR